MHTPLFSIIVPVYKTEVFLRQCVDSILNQTYSDFQVILVDDGSPDGSGAICDEYARCDSRVTVIHKENGGLVSARKAGLAQCCGRYVVNVDSDDYIALDHLSCIAQAIEHHEPDVVLFGMTRFFEQEQRPMPMLQPAGFYSGTGMEEIRRNLICADDAQLIIQYGVCTAAIKREKYVIYQAAVPENISRGEDMAVTVPLLDACDKVCVLDHCGYFYRDNPTSIMNTFRHSEVQQMKYLASYLRNALNAAYHKKIDMYVATHYFDFLDRAMLIMNYGKYRQLVKETLDAELYGYLTRARCKNNPMWQVVFLLMRYKMFGMLWILRKIRKRKN